MTKKTRTVTLDRSNAARRLDALHRMIVGLAHTCEEVSGKQGIEIGKHEAHLADVEKTGTDLELRVAAIELRLDALENPPRVTALDRLRRFLGGGK